MSKASAVIPAKVGIQENGLPDNWVITTLGKVTQPIEKVKPADEPQKEILYLDIGGIDKATNTVVDYKKYLGKDAPSRAQQAIKKGDIAFANVRPYLKNIALVPNDLDGQVGSTGFCFLRPKEGVNNKYIYYWVLSNNFINDITKYQKGSSYPAVTNKQILDRNIPLAPHEQQKRIVAKIEELFSHIDAGIEALKKAKQLLKQYRQSVLKAAVTGELTKEWREANKDKLEPATQLLERILKERRQKWEQQQLEQFKTKGKMPKDDKWKEKYRDPVGFENGGYDIPDSWVMVRSEQVCGFITKGTTPKKDKLSDGNGDVPFIQVYNLTFDTSLNFDIDPTFTDKETHEGFLARSKVYPGDVLMNIVGPPLGKVSIVSNLFDEWNINQAMAVYRPISGLNNKLLAYFLLSKPVVEWMLSKTKTTAGQVNLTLEISRDAPIPIMPEEEQDEIIRLIEEKLSASDRMLEELEVQLIKAEKNKQSVLASAYSGKT